MRSIWSGLLTFSLVTIPVKVYSAASEDEKIKFSFLHKKDLSPIGYAKFCKEEGVEVSQDEIVRGYQYEKDRFVEITDDELARANVARTNAIEIVSFVAQTEVDPNYYDKPYFLSPDKKAERPYALLREALAKSEKVAVAKFVTRNRDHVAVVRPANDVLVMNQIRFAAEVRDPSELKIPDVKLDEKELDLALMLIEHGAAEFNADDFTDTFTAEIRRVIDEKVEGKEPTSRGEVPKATNVTDLMAVLKASLERSSEEEKSVRKAGAA
jgi:DNA end-binding protein Ku